MNLLAGLSITTPPALGYFVLNIDPILIRIGPIAIHWYGLMYVVAICIALWASLRYTARLGVHEDQVWSIFIWTAIAGLIGGRLYYVVQQPDLWDHFILQPYNIIAVWDGGMAFFGAIFLGATALFIMSPRYGLSPWIALDGGALFAAVGQIFGRIGNIINGDIVGTAVASSVNVPGTVCAHAPCVAYVSSNQVPWYAMVYLNPGAFHPTSVPYQPAPIYEILLNLIMLFILWQVRFLLPRMKAGYLFTLYLAMYAISQILVFFVRDNVITPFLGINFLKQAQWTGIFVLVLAVPALYLLVRRFSAPWRYTLAKPVPWKPADGALTFKQVVERDSALALAGAASSAASSPANAAPSGPRVVAPPKLAAPTVEMDPWEPSRPLGGQLRNIFTPRDA
jgi:phosphatidylglycerol:prolipoprotein diacylglycerol transferase